jgi:hypothetical protein
MFDRNRLNRERMEIYLVHLFLAYRRLIFVIGFALLLHALMTMTSFLLAGGIILIPALLLLALSLSYRAVVLAARFGSWIGTRAKKSS